MNEQKKQKALIIALVALILGTGYIWFAQRDSSSSTHISSPTSTPKRQRVQDDTKDTKKRTRSRSNPIAQDNKRERTSSDKQNSKKKTRRGRKPKVKKKKVPPYA